MFNYCIVASFLFAKNQTLEYVFKIEIFKVKFRVDHINNYSHT